MRDELPAVAKAAQRVRVVIETAVKAFPRRDRYALGADLRAAAKQIVRLAMLAWRERQRQLLRVRELSTAVDDLKLEMMLAKDVQCFRSTAEFEAVSRLIVDLGRQVGGWLKALQAVSQNATAERRWQRAPTLSARPALSGANP